jgi:hypothetical protein
MPFGGLARRTEVLDRRKWVPTCPSVRGRIYHATADDGRRLAAGKGVG